MNLDSAYWENRYRHNDHVWDIGYPSIPLAAYIGQLKDKSLKILIPGCGNSYEAELLWTSGFPNVHILDYAELPLVNFAAKNPAFPAEQLHCEDFFLHKGKYDLILEQTFFCALDPAQRNQYAIKMHELLNDNGKVAGLLFNCSFEKDGPPFGGSKSEYEKYFAPVFSSVKMEPCYNSIPKRAGQELFIILQKRVFSHE
jgi:hypothetical protein